MDANGSHTLAARDDLSARAACSARSADSKDLVRIELRWL
jgi:hypothetical protein